MKKLLAEERRNRIVGLLDENGSVKMSELAEILDVSKETIRRDLIYLNEQGRVKKSYGGAVSYELRTKTMPSRLGSDLPVKNAICKKAMK